MIFNTVSSLTGEMTVGASFENDKDSISEARLGDIMLLELEPTLEVTGSFTATKIIPSFTWLKDNTTDIPTKQKIF